MKERTSVKERSSDKWVDGEGEGEAGGAEGGREGESGQCDKAVFFLQKISVNEMNERFVSFPIEAF